jgi:glutaredoxin
MVFASACRRGEDKLPDDVRPPEAEAIEARTFSADATLLFVYADLSGGFETAQSAAEVPEASQKVVRVIDPTASDSPRGDYDRVWVVDLSRAAGAGYQAQVVSRIEFEARAMAALPAGQASHFAAPGAPPADPKPLESHDQIILYGTSWCGACKQARTYLTQQNIPFVERDIERDAAAAAELQSKARRAGISPDRVPIIDVRGRLMVGFDATRLSHLIGDPT